MLRSKLALCAGAGLLGVSLWVGCIQGFETPPTETPTPTPTDEQTVPAGAMIVLGEASALISALATDHTAVDADELTELVATDEGAAAIAHAGLFAVDSTSFTADQIAANAVFQAAREAGIPMLFDNSDDTGHIQSLFGLGAAQPTEDAREVLAEYGVPEGDHDYTVLVEMVGDQEYLITLLGPPFNFATTSELHAAEMFEDAGTPDPNDANPETPDNTPPVTLTELSEIEPADSFIHQNLNDAARLIRIRARLAEGSTIPAAFKQGLHSQGSDGDLNNLGTIQKTWWVNMPSVHWSPGDDQQSFTDVDFRVDLFASSVPYNKFLRITTVGTGAAPGQMAHNDHRSVGYYQDQLLVQFGPQTGQDYGNENVAIYQHSPPNANNVTSVSSTTGFSVGVGGSVDAQGPGASADYTYSESQTISTQLSDFEVINDTTPDRGQWRYRLHQVGGGVYNFDNPWKSLPHRVKCHVEMHGLPTLATQTLQPNSQVVWRADGAFDGVVNYAFHVEHRVTKVDVTSEHCKFIDTVSWHTQAHWYTHWQQWTLAVDFSAVEPK